jgi:hypothetical protein
VKGTGKTAVDKGLDFNDLTIRKACFRFAEFATKNPDMMQPIAPLEHIETYPLYLQYDYFFEGTLLPEIKGLDGPALNKLVDILEKSQSIEKFHDEAYGIAVELIARQIESGGPTLFFDIEKLSTTSTVAIVPLIVDNRQQQLGGIRVPVWKQTCIDLRPLIQTHIGFEAVKALRLWRFLGKEVDELSPDLEALTSALEEFDYTINFDTSKKAKRENTISHDMRLMLDNIIDFSASSNSIVLGLDKLEQSQHPERYSIAEELVTSLSRLEPRMDAWGGEWYDKYTNLLISDEIALSHSIKLLSNSRSRRHKELLLDFYEAPFVRKYIPYEDQPVFEVQVMILILKHPAKWMIPRLMSLLPHANEWRDEGGNTVKSHVIFPLLEYLMKELPKGILEYAIEVLEVASRMKYGKKLVEHIQKDLHYAIQDYEDTILVLEHLQHMEKWYHYDNKSVWCYLGEQEPPYRYPTYPMRLVMLNKEEWFPRNIESLLETATSQYEKRALEVVLDAYEKGEIKRVQKDVSSFHYEYFR